MSNFLQNPNKLKMLAIAALGPLALTACGASTEAAEPTPTTITCTGSKLHVVEEGETLTRIFEESVSDGSLNNSDVHNTITVVANEWEDAGSREDLPDQLLVDGSNLPAFNQSKLPEPQAESTIAIPEICSKS
jgi:hypothetical protein